MAEYLLVTSLGKVNMVSGNEQYGIVEDVKGVDRSYRYRIVPKEDGYMLVDDYYYHSGLSDTLMDWQKIFVPSEAIEVLRGEMPDCKDTEERIVQSVYKSLTTQVRAGKAYYSENQCALLGLIQICNIDGYVGYANKMHVEFSNGRQFYRPNLPVEVLIWIESILDEIQIWPLDLCGD